MTEDSMGVRGLQHIGNDRGLARSTYGFILMEADRVPRVCIHICVETLLTQMQSV